MNPSQTYIVSQAPRVFMKALSQGHRPRGRALLIAGVLLGVAFIVGASIVYRQHGTGTFAPGSARAAPQPVSLVSVTLARREDLVDQLKLSGEFLPFQEISLYARVAGYVRHMKVDVGDRVRMGDVIAVLEIPELDNDLQRAAAATERAVQEVVRAKATYEEAHLTFGRLAEVLKQQPNLIAQQEIDQAKARDDTLHAAWTAAQSAEREARADQAKYTAMVAYSRITAPFAGLVTKRYADTGSLVGAGTGSGSQALVRLSQVDPLRLILPVPESAVSKVHIGTHVDISIQSAKQTLSAVVARTSGRIATETRTMHVEVDVPNPDLALAPGMDSTATLELERRKDAISIPVESLQERNVAAATVLVLDKQHKIEERKITTGLETSTRIEVLSGLKEGEMVVLGAGGRYQAGESAEPKLATDSKSQ
ncbi:MAG: efflux RND transporter periplasmic adaptor subunit [Betaproteobacteria bacterium]